MKNNNKGAVELIVIGAIVLILAVAGFFFYSNSQNKSNEMMEESGDAMMEKSSDTMMEGDEMMEKMVHGITLNVDGEEYYFDGPADGENGEKDIPGHSWVITGHGTLSGKHYNSGPNGAANFWSSDAQDAALLYDVEAIVDEWTAQKAESYADKGFVHYHELVSVDSGEMHPTKVVWLKHTAVDSFTLDGAVVGNFAHSVTPGVDLQFPPNGKTPYNPS